jgi:deoxyinosine 3'endonuclease (endonuclease V)
MPVTMQNRHAGKNKKLKMSFGTIKTIAGVDVGYDIVNDLAHCAIVHAGRRLALEQIEQTQSFYPG